jgi:hypothetical protein
MVDECYGDVTPIIPTEKFYRYSSIDLPLPRPNISNQRGSGLSEPLHQKRQRKNPRVLDEASDVVEGHRPSLLVESKQYGKQGIGHYQHNLSILRKDRIRYQCPHPFPPVMPFDAGFVAQVGAQLQRKSPLRYVEERCPKNALLSVSCQSSA